MLGVAIAIGCNDAPATRGELGGSQAYSVKTDGMPAQAGWAVARTDYTRYPGEYGDSYAQLDEGVEVVITQPVDDPDLLLVEVVGTQLVRTGVLEARRSTSPEGDTFQAELSAVELPLRVANAECPSATNALTDAFLNVHLFVDDETAARTGDPRTGDLRAAQRIRGEVYNLNTGAPPHRLTEGECTIEGFFELVPGEPVLCATSDIRVETCDGIDNDCDGVVDDEDWICAPGQVCGGAAGCR